MPYSVQLERMASVPLAVIRRHAKPSELSRVVPEGCGLVWNVVRAQHAKAGRNIAVYLDDSIRLEVGVEMVGPVEEQDGVVHSATPAGAVAWTTHLGPYGGLGAAHDRCTAGAGPTVTRSRGRAGRSTATGRTSGMRTRRRSGPTSII